jgi:hypothetical protein
VELSFDKDKAVLSNELWDDAKTKCIRFQQPSKTFDQRDKPYKPLYEAHFDYLEVLNSLKQMQLDYDSLLPKQQAAANVPLDPPPVPDFDNL